MHLYAQPSFCACPCLVPAWWVQISPLAAPFSDASLLHPLCSRTIPLRMISSGATMVTQRIGNNGEGTGFSMGRCRVGLFIWQFSIKTRPHQAPRPMMSPVFLQEICPSCHSPNSWQAAQVLLQPLAAPRELELPLVETTMVRLPAGCIKKLSLIATLL